MPKMSLARVRGPDVEEPVAVEADVMAGLVAVAMTSVMVMEWVPTMVAADRA